MASGVSSLLTSSIPSAVTVRCQGSDFSIRTKSRCLSKWPTRSRFPARTSASSSGS